MRKQSPWLNAVKIFVISLATAVARRNDIQRQFERMSMPFRFFEGFVGGECLAGSFEGLDSGTYRLNTYREPLPGEIGCYASHLALWKHAARIKEPIVILEDDCQLGANFKPAMQIASELIDQLGFIRLQNHKRSRKLHLGRASRPVSDVLGYQLHYLSIVPLCLLGYVISPTVGARLAASSTILNSPVDKFVQRTWEHGNPIYGLSPPCVKLSRHARHSTIGARPKLREKPAIAVLRRARYKVIGEFRRMSFDRQQMRALEFEQSQSSLEHCPDQSVQATK